jgi:uncharacterized protein
VAFLPRQIGLISDTHGLLREEALRALIGCDAIVHAGDVGRAEILEKLREIAPVTVVRGNVDTQGWAEGLPHAQVLQADGASLYVIHNLDELDLKPGPTGFQVVISGHTHRPKQFEKDGVLYVNPGSAGPRRFSLPITIARLSLGPRPWRVEFVACDPAR